MLGGSSDVGAAGARLTAPEKPASDVAGQSRASLVETVCLPALRNAQNHDGGWGFRFGCESRVEPTCWALQALLNWAPPTPAIRPLAKVPPQVSGESCRRGFQFLRAAQLLDGSWPAAPGQTTGCFVTSLACWALLANKNSRDELAAGLRWLVQDRPRAGAWWRSWLGRLFAARRVSQQDDSLIGWGWTPDTASWVEPTAIALIVLNQSPPELLPPEITRRRQSAEAMLYDRMCPGGGWNSGNPLVYGAAGVPLVIPTVWALLALREHARRPENLLSLDWLANSLPGVRGRASLALAQLCLEAYGRAWPAAAPRAEELHGGTQLLENIPVTAWVCLAASSNRRWLADSREAA